MKLEDKIMYLLWAMVAVSVSSLALAFAYKIIMEANYVF